MLSASLNRASPTHLFKLSAIPLLGVMRGTMRAANQSALGLTWPQSSQMLVFQSTTAGIVRILLSCRRCVIILCQ
eukprot:COSAG02_NODE_48183_length_335_cov_1.203390_1_plen_74_part_10